MGKPIHIVIPFKNYGAKTRLASVLSARERQLLAYAMLKDVLHAVLGFGRVTILSRKGPDIVSIGHQVEVEESELDLNDALNALIADAARQGWPGDILIVMADLALLTKNDLAGILNCEGDVVICPGRGGGTNMILIRAPGFRTCYQGLSFPQHLDCARQAGLRAEVFESFRAGCDIDEPEDLAEVLLHGRGESRALLEKMGLSLSEKGRTPMGESPLIRRDAPSDSGTRM